MPTTNDRKAPSEISMRTLANVIGELHAPDEYARMLVGPMGRIRNVDGKVEALFGYANGELVDQPLAILIPERLRDEHASLRNAFNASPVGRLSKGRNLVGLCKDGTEIAVTIGLVPIATEAGTFTLAIIRQVTNSSCDDDIERFMSADEVARFRGKNVEYHLRDGKSGLGRVCSSTPASAVFFVEGAPGSRIRVIPIRDIVRMIVTFPIPARLRRIA